MKGLNAPTGAWCSLTTRARGWRVRVRPSQCTYRCVVLPDSPAPTTTPAAPTSLNAPTGAWCSLTLNEKEGRGPLQGSQCTYRCVVLPDLQGRVLVTGGRQRLNAPTGAWCSLTHQESRSEGHHQERLNAPTGAWCSLTLSEKTAQGPLQSQCTYRCVVLPDPCSREWRYDATSRARSATGPGSTPPDRPAPGSD